MGRLGGILIGLLLLAGCSVVVAGSARPAADPVAVAPGGGGPGGTVPPSGLGAVAPCELLTPTQLREVGLAGSRAVPTDSGALRSCAWTDPRRLVPTVVAFGTGVDLTDMAAGMGGRPEDAEVAGFPAAYVRSAGGACSVLVEVAPDAVLTTISTDSCPAAHRIAELAVGNLPT